MASTQSFLPAEVLIMVLSHIYRSDNPQPVLHAACLVSHDWYDAAIALLYARPQLTSSRFQKFVDTVCPSVNAHVRRSTLAPLVQVLDLSKLVQGSRSMTARLLSRTRNNLREFVAPRAAFGINSCAALSKCHRLERLDLANIFDALDEETLFRAFRALSSLKSLRLPRCTYGKKAIQFECHWPPKLEHLGMSGSLGTIAHTIYANNVPDKDIDYGFSQHLTSLEIGHCSLDAPHIIVSIIRSLSAQLLTLDLSNFIVSYGQAQHRDFEFAYLNLLACPRLKTLAICYVLVDTWGYRITGVEGDLSKTDPLAPSHPLRSLTIFESVPEEIDPALTVGKTLREISLLVKNGSPWENLRTLYFDEATTDVYENIETDTWTTYVEPIEDELTRRHGSAPDVGVFLLDEKTKTRMRFADV